MNEPTINTETNLCDRFYESDPIDFIKAKHFKFTLPEQYTEVADIRQLASELNIICGMSDFEIKVPEVKECNYTKIEGLVKDDGNELLLDVDKCQAAIDAVFGEKKIINSDDIISAINKYVPHLELSWKSEFCSGSKKVLCVDGAKTKITYQSVQQAYGGMRTLFSTRIAKRTIGKLLANQLKTLF